MSNNSTIAVIGAMDVEVATLHDRLEQVQIHRFGDLQFHEGQMHGKRVVVVKCGVGKVNAARCTQLLIDRFAPDCIFNTGIAGGVGEGLHVADVIVADKLMQHDFDVTAFGYVKGNLCDRSNMAQPTVFVSDKKLVDALLEAGQTLAAGRIRTGTVVSGDVFISSVEQKTALREQFHADAAEMEGAAIAQVAAANGVPFVVLRTLSDLADGTAAESFDALEKQTAELSADIIHKMVEIL